MDVVSREDDEYFNERAQAKLEEKVNVEKMAVENRTLPCDFRR